MESLAEALGRVKDHRSKQGQRHELSALLLLVCTGIWCGCRSLQALTAWGKRQIRSRQAPQVLAAARNTVLGVLRLAGCSNVAEALRAFAQNPYHAFGQFVLLYVWISDW